MPQGSAAPAAIYVTVTDRLTGRVITSNLEPTGAPPAAPPRPPIH